MPKKKTTKKVTAKKPAKLVSAARKTRVQDMDDFSLSERGWILKFHRGIVLLEETMHSVPGDERLAVIYDALHKAGCKVEKQRLNMRRWRAPRN